MSSANAPNPSVSQDIVNASTEDKFVAMSVLAQIVRILTKLSLKLPDYKIRDLKLVVNAQKVSVWRITVNVSRKDKTVHKNVNALIVAICCDFEND